MTLRHAFALCAALLLAVAAPSHGLAADDAPVEGRDYVVIPDGQPWQPADGRIEVAEVFAYWCHVCNDFQPLVDRWQASLPADVRFSYVPAAFSPDDAYARGYFAAEALGAVDRTHHATFRAIHAAQSLPMRGASADEVATHYAGLGLDRARFAAAMQSPATDARMREARGFIVRSGVEGTPTLVVDGRYRVQARSLGDLLRIADALVARERAAAPAGAPR